MSLRGLLAALLCGVVGLGVGTLVAWVGDSEPSAAGTPAPIRAVSPSVPLDPPTTTAPYKQDIDYPTLSGGLPLVRHTIGRFSTQTWSYVVPKGWSPYDVPSDVSLTKRQAERSDEVRWRPPKEPVAGGFSLRVKAVNQHISIDLMKQGRLQALRQLDDFHLLHESPSTLYFDYRDGNDHHRFNYFRWFAAPGSSEATLEMSVVGREQDQDGLYDLLSRFTDALKAA